MLIIAVQREPQPAEEKLLIPGSYPFCMRA